MLRKILFHTIGLGLILGGWFICVINVGLDRGATPFKFFSIPNMIGLVLILIGAYFPEIAIRLFVKKEN
ncbi:hypothetical protein [Leptospira ilyithenensis]|uniref:Uncharacterized protein n=1 Tax=Leptospira ilyithenensis TaxID=2484901 RepID=A0A4R9LIL0_9LEPT|nr:hypothetical protein [Leptospira ilyithenensis]TGN06476.1 hypothetical protein EHS11_19175 [Leptospira ilyithenensis]